MQPRRRRRSRPPHRDRHLRRVIDGLLLLWVLATVGMVYEVFVVGS